MSYSLARVTDRKLWEDFLLAYSPQSFFQSWDWGMVQEDLGQKIIRYGIYKGGSLDGIAQATLVSAKRGRYIHIRHGPVFAKQTTEIWDAFTKFIRERAQEEHAWFLRMSPMIQDNPENEKNLAHIGCLPSATHEVDGEYCWVLDISQPEEILLSAMRKTTRYEIRRAEKLGVVVKKVSSDADVSAFLKLYEATYLRHGFVPHLGILEEWRILSKSNQAELLLGLYNGEVLSGALIVYYGGQAIYHHGASLSTKIRVHIYTMVRNL
jgi:peptidoglycan pentaglycine glycine transferase (the first glycine)